MSVKLANGSREQSPTVDPVKTALIFASDETFAPLAKGLVLSIIERRADPQEFVLHLVDIGCSPETLKWMDEHDVVVKRFDRNRYLRRQPKAILKPYQDAQLCRPFLPQIFPGYSIYLWCDSDIWIQDLNSLRLYRDIATNDDKQVAISPLVDSSYRYFYVNASQFTGYAHIWYKEAYGEKMASTYADRTIFSTGVFAMRAENPLWAAWALELDAIFQRNFSIDGARHLAEQTAFNYLLYASDRFVALEAVHNYNCHIGCAKRSSGGSVVIDVPPYREIGVVHLTHSSKMINSYIEEELLYDAGRYLASHEVQQIRAVIHY